MYKTKSGFTIVELLIVIVVIAILAAISIVAYNGVQQRAKATAIADGLVKIDKAFRMTAIQEGWSSWPVYPSNPTIAHLISTTALKDNLQSTPKVPGLADADWTYDNDGDFSSGACGVSDSGVSIFLPMDQATAERIDGSIDDNNTNCGKVRYRSSGVFQFVLSYSQPTGN